MVCDVIFSVPLSKVPSYSRQTSSPYTFAPQVLELTLGKFFELSLNKAKASEMLLLPQYSANASVSTITLEVSSRFVTTMGADLFTSTTSSFLQQALSVASVYGVTVCLIRLGRGFVYAYILLLLLIFLLFFI